MKMRLTLMLAIAFAVPTPVLGKTDACQAAETAYGDRDFTIVQSFAEEDDPCSQFVLGAMYLDGRGIDRNYEEAVRWFQLAAEQGHPSGQLNLGLMYELGRGVGKSGAEALRWFRAAAEQGSASGQYELGMAYYRGTIVPKDNVKAAHWIRMAAGQGHEKAISSLSVMFLPPRPINTGEMIDLAAPYIYERCLESLTESGDLKAEFEGTRFRPKSFPKAAELGVKQAFGHPSLGATRVWEAREVVDDRLNVSCTMMIDGGNVTTQFDHIALKLEDRFSKIYGEKIRAAMDDYVAGKSGGFLLSFEVDDIHLAHRLLRGTPVNPNEGYFLTITLSKPQ